MLRMCTHWLGNVMFRLQLLQHVRPLGVDSGGLGRHISGPEMGKLKRVS